MAPVAGGIANAQQDRDISTLRLGMCFLPPRPPIDWLVGMLP